VVVSVLYGTLDIVDSLFKSKPSGSRSIRAFDVDSQVGPRSRHGTRADEGNATSASRASDDAFCGRQGCPAMRALRFVIHPSVLTQRPFAIRGAHSAKTSASVAFVRRVSKICCS
jgi:hypothetical protein